MDAALATKVKDIAPWLVEGLTVDRGCGTGALMQYLASRNRKIIGVEISDTFSKNKAGVIQADVSDPVFADGTVGNIILSSVMHEVYSYGGYSTFAVSKCLDTCARELRPGGRIIIRDIWSPEDNSMYYSFEFAPHVLKRAKDFLRRRPPVGPTGHVWSREECTWVGFPEPLAVEFLSKKDYIDHWNLELKEVYTQLPLSLYRQLADVLGMKVVVAKPLCNKWIINNRWTKGVLTGPQGFPEYTNQLIVLEKVASRR